MNIKHIKEIICLLFIAFLSLEINAQISSDTMNKNSIFQKDSIVILGVMEAPYNIVSLISRSIPELKIQAKQKILFSYYKQGNVFFSVGRINTANNNINNINEIKSGSLKGKIILSYQIKYFKNYAIIMISESKVFPISFE